ncbi:SulP family inorganic anion transporter [Achromobacter seleniivolatilans]|uniref:SulP family inorganic anion transporter n=1 Tax=Achromobacter seleniivolatilans TaxID=3047478 RepID=A0ABY9M2H2_9BURK|nr:SulP family inorganic anion transporter [Achromobacter sp. R39]WMD20764.1 SulP family inorganic anion transporter [Achromobacter sp. R39]
MMQGGRNLASRLFGAWVDDVNALTLRADLTAGLLGALLVLPQGVAFATLAGLPPEYGLYSAIVPCIVAALFGSSRHVMSGPTNANSLALFAVLTPLAAAGSPGYIQLALAVTVLVGVMQWLVGTLRLGSLAHFISPSALFGFTSGAALLIAVHALKDALGLPSPASHGAGALLVSLWTHIGQVQGGALLVTLVTLGVALLVRKLDKRKPYMLLGLIAGALAAAAFNAWTAKQGGTPVSVVGAIAQPWPPFHVPSIDWRTLPDLLSVAFALTIVALAQSISIAKAVATRSGQRIDANREFVGQGLSNIVGGFFSSYLSCGSLNRSIPNYEAGAKTPLASVFSAVLLVVLVVLSAPLLAKIPNAAISGLLLLVAWTLLDIPRWRQLIRMQPGECAIAGATLAATVTIRMEVAILLGTVLSLMVYLHRTSRPAMRTMGFDSRGLDRRFVVLEHQQDALPECPQLKLLRMEGAIYFGAAAHVAQRLHELRSASGAPLHLLVMAKSMNFIDLAGAQVWEDELAARRAMGGDLYFHRPRPEVLDMWRRTGFLDRLGADHIFPDKATALHTIYAKLDPNICAGCQSKIFWECQPDSPQSSG